MRCSSAESPRADETRRAPDPCRSLGRAGRGCLRGCARRWHQHHARERQVPEQVVHPLAAGEVLTEARPGLGHRERRTRNRHLGGTRERECGSSARFGVAVVVDASDSMQGAPIQAAMSAVRAFVAQRAPGQEIAFVTFNSKSNVVLPLTKTSATIAAAIDHAPSLAYGT